jgi:hypothetical protein
MAFRKEERKESGFGKGKGLRQRECWEVPE